MSRPTRTAVIVLWFVLVHAWPLRATGLTDPLLRFRRLQTEHFFIYFHDDEERLAQRLALIVEDVRTQLAGALGLVPPARTHVIVADQADLANGWATPIPRNVVFLYPAAPSGAEFIGRTDDWMRLVFTHEYTHILHLDRSAGWARGLRATLGRSPLAMPNLWLPQWQIEGLATWHESAEEGRRHAGDFRAIPRVDAARGAVEPLDRLNGGLVRWPGGYAPYAYGLGFHEYLAGRFGEASLGALAERTSRHLPFTGALAFRGVFGQSLGSLWQEYATELRRASAGGSSPDGSPASDVEPATQLTHHGQVVVAPRFAPARCDTCAGEIVYTVRNPRTFPELRAIALDGTEGRALTTRYQGNTVGVSRDSLVFDQQELRRNVGSYGDLYLLDRGTRQTRALTREQRLLDPDVTRDGSTIVAVRQRRGERDLVMLRTGASPTEPAGGDVPIVTLASQRDVQFNAPRWSPDGRLIVAERRRLGALPELVIVDAATRELRVFASHDEARIVTPTWTPDGRSVVAAADFDGGPFDLYEFPLDGSGAVRLTRTAGAFWPDVSPDGSSVVFSGYTPAGFDVFRAPLRRIEGPRPLRSSAAEPEAIAAGAAPQPETEAQRYSPLDTLAPTSWAPVLTSDGGQARAGAAVYAADLLVRHVYAARVTWLLSAPGDAPVRPEAPDWNVSYAYTRWRPSFFTSSSRDTTFLRIGSGSSDDIPAVLRDVEIQSGVSVPIVHARTSQQFFASLVGRESQRTFADSMRQTRVVAARGGMAFSTARTYGYSISPQDGVRIGTTAEVARRGLGSDADATMITGDARAYLPGLRDHHVAALRIAAGRSIGSPFAGRLFTLGGAEASPNVLDFGGRALGLLRGFSPNRFSGTRVDVMNAEYRFPLARVERGAGTWPVFLRWVHGAVFADAGRVFGGGQDSSWKSSLGAECSVDLVAGYTWPLSATVGIATTSAGGAPRGVTVYARVGRAF